MRCVFGDGPVTKVNLELLGFVPLGFMVLNEFFGFVPLVYMQVRFACFVFVTCSSNTKQKVFPYLLVNA